MQIDNILEKALNKKRLTVEDAVALYKSDEVEKMGEVADIIMRRWHPEPIATFVIGRNINYTNVCDTFCRFCAFYRAPGKSDGDGNINARGYQSELAFFLLYKFIEKDKTTVP